jgi:anthranilate synthase component 1
MAVGAEAPAFEVTPSLDEVRSLAREYNVVPLRTTFIDDVETPVSAFLKLRGRNPGVPGVPARVGRARPGRRALLVHRRPAAQVIRWNLGDPGDPYAIAAEEVGRHRQAPLDDLPPFAAARSASSATTSSGPSRRRWGAEPRSVGLPTWRSC